MILETLFRSFLFTLLLSSLRCGAWNIPRVQNAQLDARQAASTEFLTVVRATPSSSVLPIDQDVGSTALLQDLEGLLNDVADLPADLVMVIDGIISKLEQYDSVLASLVRTSALGLLGQSTQISTVGVPTTPGTASSAAPTPVSTLKIITPTPIPRSGSAATSSSAPDESFTLPLLNVTISSISPVITPTPVLITRPLPANATSTTTIFSTSVVSAFDPYATDNVAVYFGSAPDGHAPLSDLDVICQDPDVDIINIAFVTVFFGADGYPEVDFGTGCRGQTTDQTEFDTALEDCNLLGNKLQACQAMGKKVLGSLYVDPSSAPSGNSTSYGGNSFANSSSADQFAATLWDLFGRGTLGDPDLRPLGVRPFGPEVVLDGFDVYVASAGTPSSSPTPSPPYANATTAGSAASLANFNEFFTALRGTFESDDSKDYYISVSLPCTMPSALDSSSLDQVNWVSIRFFGDPSCSIDSPGFQDSLASWVDMLEGPAPVSLATGPAVTAVTAAATTVSPPSVSGTGPPISPIVPVAAPSSPSRGTASNGAPSDAPSEVEPVATFLIIEDVTTTLTATISVTLTASPRPLVPPGNLSVVAGTATSMTTVLIPANASFTSYTASTNATTFVAISPVTSGRRSDIADNTMIPAASASSNPVGPATPSAAIPAVTSPVSTNSSALPSMISSFIDHRLEERGPKRHPRQDAKRGFASPRFLLGLLAPQWSANGTNPSAAVGSAGDVDPFTLEGLIRIASTMAGFGGFMVWGGVPDYEPQGSSGGFLEFVLGALMGSL